MALIEIDRKKKTVTITMPLESPRRSASGKNMLIASTRGMKSGEVNFMRKPVSVIANAFFRNEESPRSKKTKDDEPVGDDKIDAE